LSKRTRDGNSASESEGESSHAYTSERMPALMSRVIGMKRKFPKHAGNLLIKSTPTLASIEFGFSLLRIDECIGDFH
jgi:hypothetical protein